jgi:nitrogen fixation protein NifX
MMSAELSRELALRIGLAARELPDTDPRRLIHVLTACVGLPLTESKLNNLKVKDLKTAADGEFADLNQEMLKSALNQLKGTDAVSADLPAIEAFTEGDMPNSVRVAFASNTVDRLDGHFGSCARFFIYQVSKDEKRLIDIRFTHNIVETDLTDDKNAFRSDLIKDCHLLYVVSIGGPPAAKVVKAGVHPVKMPEGLTIAEVITQLQTVLMGTPPPWLAKIMGISSPKREFGSDEDDEA